jgi:hypothetical protein
LVVVVGPVVVGPVEVPAVVPPPEVDAALAGAGLDAVEELSLEPPQPAIAAATAIAVAIPQAFIVRSVI